MDPAPNDRRAYWQDRLGRLRLEAEPLDVQLARRHAACWALTSITTAIAAGFLALFASFDRPDLGLGLAALLWLPVVGVSWWDHARLSRVVREYEDDLAGRADEGGPAPS
ncbi:hypothetical protein [Paludisphaera soli]|uniref:hypothetical protein n=1 Tax=Paludisphaera soli TaxID=2712865 RepID=UPI0013ED1C2D|nr:hypothetical protein [Paludisphaera soli]